jgi:hypothetical protein
MKKMTRVLLFAALPLAAMFMFSSYSSVSGVQCPDGDTGITVLIPHPSDCSAFFLCSNGVPVLQKCPSGLHFNANLGTCDWPHNAGCDPGTGTGKCSISRKCPNGSVVKCEGYHCQGNLVTGEAWCDGVALVCP